MRIHRLSRLLIFKFAFQKLFRYQ